MRDWVLSVCDGEAKHEPIFILVGNKIDNSDRKVSFEDGKELAKSLRIEGIECMETSAINDSGVNEVFNTLARKIYTAIEDGTMELRELNRSIQLHMNNNDHHVDPESHHSDGSCWLRRSSCSS